MDDDSALFEKMLQQKQQEKLLLAINALTKSIEQEGNHKLEDIIGKLLVSIEAVTLALKTTRIDTKTSLGEETVLFKAIEDLKKYIKMAQIKKEWEISFERDKMGYIQSPIVFKQKQ